MADTVKEKCKLDIGLVHITDQPVSFQYDQKSHDEAADNVPRIDDQIKKKENACYNKQNPDNNIKEKPVINHIFQFCGIGKLWSGQALWPPY